MVISVAGALVTGVILTIFMANENGAWANAKNTLSRAIMAARAAKPIWLPWWAIR